MQARRRFTTSESEETNLTTVVVDADPNDTEKKYTKKWNFRNFSNHITTTSGNALKALVQSVDNTILPTTERELLITDELEDHFSKEDIVVMTSRDRTNEFANAIRSLQSRNISRAVNIKDPRKARQIQSYSEFMMIAKYIGKNIASTYAKLEKLTICKY